MDMTTLLKNFADPLIINTMSTGELLRCITATVIMGMGITFIVLIILMFVIKMQEKLFVPKVVEPVKSVQSARISEKPVLESDDSELIAVITAAVATKIGTSGSNVVIKKIQKVRATVIG